MAVPVFRTPLPSLDVLERLPQPIEVHMPDVFVEKPEPVKARL
ncbi:hypothetical protein [Pseudanabaena sp. FACHB-2040]|nr:hypothetical protein [Pseudanabaena sp. FACHB-2040]